MSQNLDFFEAIRQKRITFLGAGISNMPIIRMFAAKGAAVTVCDKSPREKIPSADELESLGVTLNLGADYLDTLDADIIFRTPGLSYFTPELQTARERGCIITSEMEIFFSLCPCAIFAVTGSDGKTTTTSIMAEILRSQGYRVYLGGNIGSPLLPEVESMRQEDIAVVELSSFQLMSMRCSPDVAVVTNISPNHLDVHKDMDEYIEAKMQIIRHQTGFGRAVLNFDNPVTREFGYQTRGETFFFSRTTPVRSGAFVENNNIYLASKGMQTYVMRRDEILLPGDHNLENWLAAIAAVEGYAEPEAIRQVAQTFSGVEHRAEFVREIDGVKYYNDSIASSPTRTISGTLSLYDRKIVLIAGGYDKKIPFDTLGKAILEKVKLLILIGVTAPKIEAAVKQAASVNSTKDMPEIIYASSLEEAVMQSRTKTVSGDIVSLSPACASFDMFANFAVRGETFKKLVNSLEGTSC